MRYFFLTMIILVLTVLAIAGFRGSKSTKPPIEVFPDMDRQLYFKAQATSGFFADGRADRVPVEGTIPMTVQIDPMLGTYLHTGKIGDKWGDGIPLEVTQAFMERGRDRYNIYCAVCHGEAGKGNGVATEYGLLGVANFHQDRLRKMPDGEIFNTIGQGKGQMGPYPHIRAEDRWAIIAYLRALQLSQNATLEDVPEDKRGSLSGNIYD